jgi:hypothetical protein
MPIGTGSFNLGMGDKLDTSQTMELQPGGFAYAPAGMASAVVISTPFLCSDHLPD